MSLNRYFGAEFNENKISADNKNQIEKNPFEDDPIEIQPALIEVQNCKDKDELKSLAKKYRIVEISSLKKEEIREALYQAIRNGAEKQISAYERLGNILVEYTCSCKYTVTANIPKKYESKQRYCKRCAKLMKKKVIK
jgi:hypothetical protein